LALGREQLLLQGDVGVDLLLNLLLAGDGQGLSARVGLLQALRVLPLQLLQRPQRSALARSVRRPPQRD
jgi:hypothetical protein